jgi:excisionase family DNA binding protein
MSSSLLDPLAALIELVRGAAREGAEQALAAEHAGEPPALTPLLDKRELAHALRISTAKVDRLCRDGRIPFVAVGDVRRFDLSAVLAALPQQRRTPDGPTVAPLVMRKQVLTGVRLLSRGSRRSS